MKNNDPYDINKCRSIGQVAGRLSGGFPLFPLVRYKSIEPWLKRKDVKAKGDKETNSGRVTVPKPFLSSILSGSESSRMCSAHV